MGQQQITPTDFSNKFLSYPETKSKFLGTSKFYNYFPPFFTVGKQEKSHS